MVSEQTIKMLNISHPELIALMTEHGVEQSIPKGAELLREGQYVKVIPFVLEGLIKVSTRYEGKELLLYYIEPKESCVMSFSSGLHQTPSQVYAVTEADSRLVLIPSAQLTQWVAKYPSLNQLFFNQYSMRYQELIASLNHILFDSLDQKILNYLENKLRLTGSSEISMTHREIAQDLATSREVVTRIIKKLEASNMIEQTAEGLKLKK
jgi:CRP/FNR family transcriptional regulator